MAHKILRLLPQFIKDLNRLQPEYSHSDRIWRIPMRTGARPKDWAMTHITHYQDTYYFSWTASRLSLELKASGKTVNSALDAESDRELNRLTWALTHLNRQVSRIGKNWVAAYRETLREYPLNMRYGIVPKSVIWKYYPDIYRPDTQLGEARTAEFIAKQRTYRFREEYNGHHKKMTLAIFMRYCKLAYLANSEQFKAAAQKKMSGLQMYRLFADGRDEGLSALPAKSAEAFGKWYHSSRGGGHPWEIYRGGNTTHIDLGVIDRHQGWSVFLRGSSTGRMVETIKIALELTQAGLPIEFHDAEEFTLRLVGADNVGIIPDYLVNHRAAQEFEKQDKVFDCAHLYDLPRSNRIIAFITWKPLTPLRPLVI